MKDVQSYGDEQAQHLKAMIALSRTFQSVRKRELKTITSAGLTVAQFGVLEILFHKGDLRICDIIAGTLSTGGNMTVVVSNLEKDGFIKRAVDPKDGRATLVAITEKGQSLMRRMFPDHVQNIAEIFGVLEAKEEFELIRLLKKVSGGKP